MPSGTIRGWDDIRTKTDPVDTFDDGVVRIREIWVGNLPNSVTDVILYNHFFIYGEIEKIDTFGSKCFAFVRFKQVSAAARAIKCSGNILIEGRPVRISFADQARRSDAIGNKPGYEPNERNAKTLYIQYNSDGPIKSDAKISQ